MESGTEGPPATTCQQCGALCCKKGEIFLPANEYRRIREHAEKLGAHEAAELADRITDHGLFYIYDQRTGCQFLDAKNLCRLHDLGLKPSECFWWPYHIFKGEEPGRLEIKLFMDCCDGHAASHVSLPEHHVIEAEAHSIGLDVIHKFRETYRGGNGALRHIKSIECLPLN